MLANRFDLQQGDNLDSTYKVVRTLGEGSYGIVYLVEDRHHPNILKAAKVLKLYSHDPKVREQLAKRFEREFQCGKIRSPYLVEATETGEIEGNPYFLMEYCPNGSIKKWVGKQVPFWRITRFVEEALLGLDALHKNGVIHRDLKPDNILLGKQEQIKLTDFGIAGYQNSRMTKVNVRGKARDIFGTFAYIAPEQANSLLSFKTLGPTADLWSLGVTVYEVIASKLPFGKLTHDADLGAYIKNASHGAFDPLNRVRPEIPENLCQFVSDCLIPDHTKRLNSVGKALAYFQRGFGKDTPFTSNMEGRDRPIMLNEPPVFDPRIDLLGLQVMHGDEPGRIYNLSREVNGVNLSITLGWYDSNRPRNNHVTIVEKQTAFISRYHATIETSPRKDRWIIKDGQLRYDKGTYNWRRSTNGTLVNALEVDEKGIEIKPNDIITIGDTTLRVVVKKM